VNISIAIHPEAEREREQIAGGDRPLGRHCLVQRPARPDEHATVGELGEQPVDGLLEPEQPLLDDRESRRRGDRLSGRSDPKQRVAPDRRTADREMTERFGVHLFAVCRQHNQPRNICVADVTRGDVAQQFKFHIATMTAGATETHRVLPGPRFA
jgi:hypothetical protein